MHNNTKHDHGMPRPLDDFKRLDAAVFWLCSIAVIGFVAVLVWAIGFGWR